MWEGEEKTFLKQAEFLGVREESREMGERGKGGWELVLVLPSEGNVVVSLSICLSNLYKNLACLFVCVQ